MPCGSWQVPPTPVGTEDRTGLRQRKEKGQGLGRAKGEGDGSVETGSRVLPSSPSWDPEKKETALFFEVLGTTGLRASGGTEQKGNKRFSTRPSSGGRSGAVTIS